MCSFKSKKATMAKTTWKLDPMHSEVNFKVRHLVISTVSGSFGSFDAEMVTEGDDFSTAEVSFAIEVDSIQTGVADRDGHLKSDDFFNAGQYPKIVFKSTGASSAANDLITVEGHLTVRDITKPMRFEVVHGGTMVDFYGNTKAGFELEGTVKRKDFGLMWDAVTEAGGVVVSDEVRFQISLQFAKAQ
jgi:polyisoprenoid-binding protein YceI